MTSVFKQKKNICIYNTYAIKIFRKRKKQSLEYIYSFFKIYLQISFLNDETCKVLCTKKYIPNDSISAMKLFVLKRGMNLNYQHHFIVGKLILILL